MTLFTIFHDEHSEGCSEPIVTYDNAAEAIIKVGALTEKYGKGFKILQHELRVDNPRSVYAS